MRRACVIPLIILVAVPAAWGGTIVVDVGGGGEFTEIQPAIDAAVDGDEVLVKPGEYVITVAITFRGKAITVRGENGAEGTTIRMSEPPGEYSRASVVIFETGERQASVLEGFTLTGGRGTWVAGIGGGILCDEGTAPTIIGCTIHGNSAVNFGGGVCCMTCDATLRDCTIAENSSQLYGGGVYCSDGSSPVLTRCTISKNWAISGGGISVDGGAPTLRDCRFMGNSVDSGGGAAYNVMGSPRMINCLFSGNAAENDGGAILNDTSSLSLVNCTLSGNTARLGAGIRNYMAVTLNLTNCILWGNVAEIGTGEAAQIDDLNSTTTVDYSCLEGWTGKFAGIGSMGDDPRFVDADGQDDQYGTDDDDLRLQPGSPCIDGGTREGAPTADMEGFGRPCGTGVDMGAYEYGQCPSPVPFRRGDSSADGAIHLIDVIATLMHVFGGGVALPCEKSMDCDDNGKVQLLDVVLLLKFVFVPGAPPPADPFQGCGLDPTIDDLACESFRYCE